MSSPLKIVGLDALDHSRFLVYLSDETFVAITAEQVARCFPDRDAVSSLHDEPAGPDE